MSTQEILFNKAEFIKSATKPSQYPDSELPEIAVLGRSNVGKSSLLNSLFQRKSLVKVSRTPGRTQLINFFCIDEQVMMVDLPGYGFAKVPEKIRRQWRPMIERYLENRENLIGCLFLLDIRRTPNDDDLDLWEWLHHFDMTPIPILTKSDKLSAQKRRNQARIIAELLEIPLEAMIISSSKTNAGRPQLRNAIQALCL